MSRCPSLGELPAPPPGRKGWPWTEDGERLPDAMPDGRPWPRISLVTPSYNQAAFVEHTLRSVLLQGYPDLEYIVMDGGSTDGSADIIRKYARWLTHWASEKDRGQCDAINRGFALASGQIYSWLNSDDYLVQGALKHIALAWAAAPDAGGWCGACQCIDPRGRTMYIRAPRRLDAAGLARWNENSVGQPAFFFAASSWQACGPLDESLHYGMDLDLWLKLAKAFRIEPVPHQIAVERDHPAAKTGGNRGRMYAVQCQVQFRHGYELEAMDDITRWMNDYVRMSAGWERVMKLPLARQILLPIARRMAPPPPARRG